MSVRNLDVHADLQGMISCSDTYEPIKTKHLIRLKNWKKMRNLRVPI